MYIFYLSEEKYQNNMILVIIIIFVTSHFEDVERSFWPLVFSLNEVQ